MDINQPTIKYANELTNHRIKSYVANLEEPLHFVEDEKVDLIVLPLYFITLKTGTIPLKNFI